MYSKDTFALTLFLVVFGLAASREMTSITLFSQGMSWDQANRHCQSIGQDLLTIVSTDQHQVMGNFIQNGQPWYNKIQDSWSSLHSPKNSTNERTPHKWIRGCLPLDATLKHIWFTNEPLNLDSSGCTILQRDNGVFKLRSSQCNQNKQFMCQKTEGPCRFEMSTSKTVTGASNEVSLTSITADDCKKKCLQITFEEECWAFTFKSAAGSCVLHLHADSAFYFDTKTTSLAGGDLYMKRCYEGLLDETAYSTDVISNQEPTSSPCNSSSTVITAVELYALEVTTRLKASIVFHEDVGTKSVANDVCKSDGGSLIYIDYPIHQLLIKEQANWTPSTYVWIGIKDTASWVSGENISPTSYINGLTSGDVILDNTLNQWSSTDPNKQYQFICQIRSGDCDFVEIPNKAISSSLVDKNVTLSTCKTRCNSYSYNGDDCWAFTYSSTDISCYYQFTSDPGIATNDSVVIDGSPYNLNLYRRVCYKFSLVPVFSSVPTSTIDTTVESSTSAGPTSSPAFGTTSVQWSTAIDESRSSTDQTTNDDVESSISTTSSSDLYTTITSSSDWYTTVSSSSDLYTTITSSFDWYTTISSSSDRYTTISTSSDVYTTITSSSDWYTTVSSSSDLYTTITSSFDWYTTISSSSDLYTTVNSLSDLYTTISSSSDLYTTITSSSDLYTTINGSSDLYTTISTSSDLYTTISSSSDLYTAVSSVIVTDPISIEATGMTISDTTLKESTSSALDTTITPNVTCACFCGQVILELGSSELAEKLVNISSELYIDPKTLSLAKRKLISVDDPRPSARVVGSLLGIVTLTVIFGFLILLDIQNLISWFQKLITSK